MITFETNRLFVRPWTLSTQDRNVFHTIHSDAQIRKFYVSRKTRAESDAELEKVIQEFPTDGLNWQAVCLKSTGEPIGYAGLAHVTDELPFSPCIEIGWQFLPAFWGNGYATESARGFLQRGFQHHNLSEIVAFAVHNNHASISVMEKIGMTKDIGADFDFSFIPKGFEHLNPQILYRIQPS
jgi:RimJ/RimL family protein N-acetyltransferase